MGYELLEKDSLITLKTILDKYKETIKNKVQKENSQRYKDAIYELSRINQELDGRF